jgi:hypothetical protein
VNPKAGLLTLLAVAVFGGVTIQRSLKSGRDSGVAGAVT